MPTVMRCTLDGLSNEYATDRSSTKHKHCFEDMLIENQHSLGSAPKSNTWCHYVNRATHSRTGLLRHGEAQAECSAMGLRPSLFPFDVGINFAKQTAELKSSAQGSR